MYLSYFMQASRLSRYVRTLWNYIFMGDRIWQGRTNFGCQNWSGGTVFGGGPIFSLQFYTLYESDLSHYRWSPRPQSAVPRTKCGSHGWSLRTMHGCHCNTWSRGTIYAAVCPPLAIDGSPPPYITFTDVKL